jgi:hypothetical protein
VAVPSREASLTDPDVYPGTHALQFLEQAIRVGQMPHHLRIEYQIRLGMKNAFMRL